MEMDMHHFLPCTGAKWNDVAFLNTRRIGVGRVMRGSTWPMPAADASLRSMTVAWASLGITKVCPGPWG